MKTSSLILCLCCWHAVFASTVVVSAFASSSPSQLLRLPSGCYTMTKSTAYYSPPGSFISSGSVVAAAMPFLSQHHYRHHQQQHHGVLGAAATTTTTTRLHLLSIPRGGGATTATTAEVATTITTFSSTIITTLTAKLSQWTSTPNGMFNLVLALLGMSTAVLKLYNNNRMMLLNNDNDRERGEESVVTVVVSFILRANHTLYFVLSKFSHAIVNCNITPLAIAYHSTDPITSNDRRRIQKSNPFRCDS